jgi:hypothetical protein
LVAFCGGRPARFFVRINDGLCDNCFFHCDEPLSSRFNDEFLGVSPGAPELRNEFKFGT